MMRPQNRLTPLEMGVPGQNDVPVFFPQLHQGLLQILEGKKIARNLFLQPKP
jgi:hypothetical protein